MLRGTCLRAALLAALIGPLNDAVAAELQTTLAELGKTLNIDLEKTSVSGLSSGGFMAHQFHIAHSANLMGAGIVAGGPFYCARGDVTRGMRTCTAFAVEGCSNFFGIGYPALAGWCTGLLYDGPEQAPPGKPASDSAMEMAQQSVNYTFQTGLDIDNPQGLVGDRVIILHGQEDRLLPPGVSDALNQYYYKVYDKLRVRPAEGTLRYLTSLPASHSMPTDNKIGLKIGTRLDTVNIQVGRCRAFGSPYVNACGRDDCASSCCPASNPSICGDPTNAENAQCKTCDLACTKACFSEIDAAGAILKHIYGGLNDRSNDPNLRVRDWGGTAPPTVQDECESAGTVDTRCKWLQERIFAFKQSEVFNEDATAISEASLADKGFVFVPPGCRQGNVCRLHIAFHGCRQGYGFSSGEPTSQSLYGGTKGWTHFVENAGYDEWADANDIVVLYPQVAGREYPDFVFDMDALQHSNPQGCWDLWGYTDPNYHTRSGKQIKAVWKMIQALAPKLKGQAPESDKIK